MIVLGRTAAWERGLRGALALLCGTIIFPNESQATDSARFFEGPVRATVTRVIDGDTFEASAAIWLDQQIVVHVRIAGIDAPELRARCDAERQGAEAARDFLARRIAGGEVRLSRIRYDKYGGRVDAAVADDRGDIAQALLRARLARPYDGGRREGWCGY